ncbi:MAG: NAD-dependent epimerase/dehydratase family protein [Pyrinomonadaceae bacterium MAG19_C2-C3]|nr:NAD-dependent epimerase/dehydratase family protein [Pyrinomonadaceae bacterium MAG19_C2-C3]
MHARCLVTGATGFLGGFVVRHLARAEDEITILSRTPPAVANTGQFIADARLKFISSDLTAPVLNLGDKAYDTVYHLAGLAHSVPRTSQERERFFAVNVAGTKRLLAALERTSGLPEAFVFISSVAVYGIERGEHIAETTARRAEDAYGASKREAEDAVVEWCAVRGVRAVVVRLPLVVGAGAPGNFGAMIHALRRGRYLGIGAGAARRSMVLARDVAQALPQLAQTAGTFHLTDGEHPSFAELENALCLAMRRSTPHGIPLSLARAGAVVGDALLNLTGVRLPLTSRAIEKMTSTLTFSDCEARRAINWNPSKVIDRAAELVAARDGKPRSTLLTEDFDLEPERVERERLS